MRPACILALKQAGTEQKYMSDSSKIRAAMTALETAINATEIAYSDESRTAPWATRAASEIEPAKWTRLIEEALDKPAQLDGLRVQFDEGTLTFISALLTYNNSRQRVFDCYTPLCDGITAINEIIESPESKSLSSHLVLAMKALSLRGIQTHRTPRAESSVNMRDDLSDRTRSYSILVNVFGVLAAQLKIVRVQCPKPSYTQDLVVPGRHIKPYLSSDVDLRAVRRVPFVDCVNSKHPCNVKLADAHDAVEKAVSNAYDMAKKMKADHNGQVNERQHAGRMVDMLHGAPQGCGGNIADQVQAQNKRRLAYETARLQLLMAIDELQARYEELIVALVEAGAETDVLLKEMQGEQHVTCDRQDTVRIAMNNCLAADLYLRRVGRDIADLKNNQAKDLSLGNGAAAVAASYDEWAPCYRSFKSLSTDGAKE
jgi:hypothetical protein